MKSFSISTCLLIVALWISVVTAAGHLVTVNLGVKGPDFGPIDEASTILQLVRKKPGATRYEATYTTREGEIVFHCDLEKQMIVRTITHHDRHGTSETWARHTMYRLENAANGGSLENTPEGKLFGTLKSF